MEHAAENRQRETWLFCLIRGAFWVAIPLALFIAKVPIGTDGAETKTATALAGVATVVNLAE